MIKKYIVNLLLALDEVGNAIFAGDPGETISAHLGRLAAANGGAIPRRRPLARAVWSLLEWIEPGHSARAIKEGLGSRGVVDTPTKLERRRYSRRTCDRVGKKTL